MSRETSPVTELWFGAFIVAVCGLVLWEARDLPAGTFEPLGSAPVPRGVAVLIILLTLAVMARAWARLRRGETGQRDEVEPRWADAAMVLALTVVYALLLHFRLLRFDILTSIYLFLTIGLLNQFSRALLPATIAVALGVSFGSYYAFTKVFVVDLPGAF